MAQGPGPDTRGFRDVMGRFATGVTVVTLTLDGEHHGMTANAVTSVSLDPMLLLVCIDRGASMYERTLRAPAFAVNILEDDQRPLSELFARHGAPDEVMGGVAWHAGPLGSPLLDRCLAQAECRVVDRFPGGDHAIVIGRVEHLALPVADGAPLVFFGGRYHRLGDAL